MQLKFVSAGTFIDSYSFFCSGIKKLGFGSAQAQIDFEVIIKSVYKCKFHSFWLSQYLSISGLASTENSRTQLYDATISIFIRPTKLKLKTFWLIKMELQQTVSSIFQVCFSLSVH